MDTKEMVEKRKIELIDLLNDQSIFVVQFTADMDDKYYDVEFRRIELNIPSSFSSYTASKCDRNNYIIHIHAIHIHAIHIHIIHIYIHAIHI